MQNICRVLSNVAVLVAASCALAISAPAQTCSQDGVCVTSPTEGETTSMPVWVRANATTCKGSPVTSFGYSIGISKFMNWGFSDVYGWHTDTVDFRLASQPSIGKYTVHFKAWSSAGECDLPIDVNVTGNQTILVSDVQNNPTNPYGDNNDAYPGNIEICPHTSESGTKLNNYWWWDWDPGTTQCTYPQVGVSASDYSTSTKGQTSPSQDGLSRVFYTVWNDSNGGNPGERYSINYAQNESTANSFVYDTYIYIPQQYVQNVNTVQMDTNWVDSSGNVYVFGMQCDHGHGDWMYTTYYWNSTMQKWQSQWNTGTQTVKCDPHNWTTTSTPDGWHHVQLAGHRDGSGNAYYDYIVLDAYYYKTETMGGMGFRGFREVGIQVISC